MKDLIDRGRLKERLFPVVPDPRGVSKPETSLYMQGWNDAITSIIENEPSVEPGWIPVTERLPEEDKEVLIAYKEKVDELDKPYSSIDITTYGQMYFGGNKVGDHKHWRSPFQYFHENYEVTAWMPLPEPYHPEEVTG